MIESAATAAEWRITGAEADPDGYYDVWLEKGDGDAYASAYVAAGNRAARGTHEPADWWTRVEKCDDPEALVWLEAHEWELGDACMTGRP